LVWLLSLVFWLWLWLKVVAGTSPIFIALMWMAVIPYIAGDIIKTVAAATIARGITPKSAYNGEVDKGKWANWHVP
jgi:biotin transport system substrate-specific component